MSDTSKKLKELELEEELLDRKARLKSKKMMDERANSICVGSATGGITEIVMRSNSNSMWHQMQPVEVVEFIRTLSESIGLEVAIRPRNDFSSWRSWDLSNPDEITWIGSAPWQLSTDKRNRLKKLKEGGIFKELNPVDDSDDEV